MLGLQVCIFHIHDTEGFRNRFFFWIYTCCPAHIHVIIELFTLNPRNKTAWTKYPCVNINLLQQEPQSQYFVLKTDDKSCNPPLQTHPTPKYIFVLHMQRLLYKLITHWPELHNLGGYLRWCSQLQHTLISCCCLPSSSAAGPQNLGHQLSPQTCCLDRESQNLHITSNQLLICKQNVTGTYVISVHNTKPSKHPIMPPQVGLRGNRWYICLISDANLRVKLMTWNHHFLHDTYDQQPSIHEPASALFV